MICLITSDREGKNIYSQSLNTIWVFLLSYFRSTCDRVTAHSDNYFLNVWPARIVFDYSNIWFCLFDLRLKAQLNINEQSLIPSKWIHRKNIYEYYSQDARSQERKYLKLRETRTIFPLETSEKALFCQKLMSPELWDNFFMSPELWDKFFLAQISCLWYLVIVACYATIPGQAVSIDLSKQKKLYWRLRYILTLKQGTRYTSWQRNRKSK